MLPFKPIVLYVIAIVSAALIATVTIYVHGAEKAKGQRDLLVTKLEGMTAAAIKNQASFESCQLTNTNNAKEAVLQKTRADKAEARVLNEVKTNDTAVRKIWKDSTKFSNNCHGIDGDFRKWVQDN